jgi:hypothetical protein
MAEKQFIVKKKPVKKTEGESVLKKVEPVKEAEHNEPTEVKEQQEEPANDSNEFSFDGYLSKLKTRVENMKKDDVNDDYKDKFLFGKYSEIDFGVVSRNYPDYIVFLFSKKMGSKMEHDKQRYRDWVEARANRNK